MKQLVEEIKQVDVHFIVEVAVVQVDLAGVRAKISMPIELLEGESPCLCWGPIGHGIPPQHVLGLKAQVLVKGFVRLCDLRAQSAKYRLSHRVVCPKVM